MRLLSIGLPLRQCLKAARLSLVYHFYPLSLSLSLAPAACSASRVYVYVSVVASLEVKNLQKVSFLIFCGGVFVRVRFV